MVQKIINIELTGVKRTKYLISNNVFYQNLF